MQTAHEIAGGSADPYATYLTSSSDRGYYYTTGSGGEVQAGAPVGADSRWHGAQAMLTDLGLSPDEPVQRDQLRALMRGVSPRNIEREGLTNCGAAIYSNTNFSQPPHSAASRTTSTAACRERCAGCSYLS
jgi:hypothetical protein